MKRPRVRERRSYPGDGTTPYFSAGKTEFEYQLNWWLTYIQALKFRRSGWTHEDLVLQHIGQHKKPGLFRAEVNEALRKKNHRFLRELGSVLTKGRAPDFDSTEHTIIRLWNNPVAPGLPRLKSFTCPAACTVIECTPAKGIDPIDPVNYRNRFRRMGLKQAPGPLVRPRELTSEMLRRICASEREAARQSPEKVLFGVEEIE